MITKKQAIEILDATHPPHQGDRAEDWRWGGLEAVDALDRAGAFPSEETAAEISDVAETIIANQYRLSVRGVGVGESDWRDAALRLASACRAAGLVKP